jgi:hypothetical protein
MSKHQILGPGERYATAADFDHDDNDDIIPLAKVRTGGEFDGVGVTYGIFARWRDGRTDYMVHYLPAGPVGLQTVVIGEGLTWSQAMDLVRDRIAAEIDAEQS